MENIFINHWAVLTAAVSDLVVGALWYSPLMFYKAWMHENKLTDEQLKAESSPLIYILTFIFALIISYNLAFFLGDAETDALWGAQAGLLAGLGWAAMAFTIIALFERKSWKYIFINTGYIVTAFVLKGFIIGAWR